jgi:hypothetical protein
LVSFLKFISILKLETLACIDNYFENKLKP